MTRLETLKVILGMDVLTASEAVLDIMEHAITRRASPWLDTNPVSPGPGYLAPRPEYLQYIPPQSAKVADLLLPNILSGICLITANQLVAYTISTHPSPVSIYYIQSGIPGVSGKHK